MTTQHTPGPWKVPYTNFGEVRTVEGALVAKCLKLRNLTTLEANARIIAAAPDMLAALNEINNWLVCAAIATPQDMAQSFQHMQQIAESAIAKAKGQAT